VSLDPKGGQARSNLYGVHSSRFVVLRIRSKRRCGVVKELYVVLQPAVFRRRLLLGKEISQVEERVITARLMGGDSVIVRQMPTRAYNGKTGRASQFSRR